ncbi:glycosyltransferase [Pseudomonas sichuanensis]|uniref:glycosyltransferase n=1 Tax=Pseudomonas sichuanensis TaxID=2213015 RepID=UPI002160A8E2|nr:glycosyltransferase [Pseudomonas sichuanensis]UVK84510.1 glycosyltransferase [Pseudomonas sichuanensis]
MKTLLIVSFSIIQSDPRVMRQIRLLEGKYRVVVAGYGPPPDAQVEFVALERGPRSVLTKSYWALKLLAGLHESYYWCQQQVATGLRLLGGRAFDLVIANDVSSLPLALKLANKAPVLIDSHEYSPREFEDKWVWRQLFGPHADYLCRRYLPQAASMTTVCRGISDEYQRVYGVPSTVIHNAPVLQELQPSPVDANRIRLIHHGAAIRSRHLEVMIEMVDYLDARFTLDFMLVASDEPYLEELKARVQGEPRIRFIDPVPMPQICAALNDHDVGVFLLPPVNFNYQHALPNKFFEFVQARLGIAIGPSPEMAGLLKQHELGVLADSFEPEALARALNALSAEQVLGFKAASHAAAHELSYAHDGALLMSTLERLL